MVSTLVDISELEQMHATLLEAQKMAGLGTLVAGLAHEMNSPLQVITGSVDSLLNRLKKGDPITPEHMEKYLGNASRNAWRIAEMVRALMIYAHPMKMNIVACDINCLVQDSVLLTENQFKHSNIHVHLTLEEGLPELQCEASDLVQTLVALLKNAGDALPEGGQITLTSAYDAAQEEINLTVEDDGVGIEPENLDKIFDPFFTTKPPGQGVGLGLTVMQGVMRKYGGSIKVESVPGKGSAFHLTFPLKDSAAKTKNPFTAEGRYAEIKPEKRENT
jgi:signal transduction histidine kinase